MYTDIIFISYYEPNADTNFRRILDLVPHGGIGRVNNVDGIANAHLAAAKKAGTPWFYVVDGDNWINEDFKFNFEPKQHDPLNVTYVWRARNPYNRLTYGYGGIKLFHRLTLKQKLEQFEMGVDMSTGLFEHFRPMNEIASETHFATSPYDAWKAAFRECVKLSSKAIARRRQIEDDQRLRIWTNLAEGEYAEWILNGARMGEEYGTANIGNTEALKQINNFEFLRDMFEKIA